MSPSHGSSAPVVVVGGGYAGVAAAQAAAHDGARVVVVDAGGRHELLPRLATVAGGGGAPPDVAVPLAPLVDELVVARAESVDTDGRRLLTTDGRQIDWSALVVTTGSVPRQATPPALAANAAVLRTADDALTIRAALDAAPPALVVVGGGPTGVQLAGEAAVAHPRLPIALIEREERLLGGFHPSLGRHATWLLIERGVEVLTSTSLHDADATGVAIRGGLREWIDGLVVWTGGFAARGTALLPGADTDHDGRLLVDDALRVRGHRRVLAAGDVAAHRDAGGRTLAMSAQVAVQAGAAAGRAAAAIARGAEPARASLVDIGWVVPMGAGRGVAEVGPLAPGDVARFALVPALQAALGRLRAPRLGPVRLADPGTDRLVGPLHELIDLQHLLEVGGVATAVAHRAHPR